MGRKPRVDRSPEEKWQIVQEGIKSGNVSETCRRHGIAANLFYRWKDEAEQEAKAALGGRSAAAAETDYATRLSAGGVADEWVTQMLRQGDAQVFKKYSQMKLQMKREALEKLNRRANEMVPASPAPMCTVMMQ